MCHSVERYHKIEIKIVFFCTTFKKKCYLCTGKNAYKGRTDIVSVVFSDAVTSGV